MKRKLKLYLAHGLPTRHKVRKIELELEAKYNIELHNPFYDSGSRDDIDNLDNNKTCDEIRNKFDISHCWDIVRRDLKAIDRNDGVVAYIIGDVGLGTAFEMGYCYYWTGALLIIVSEKYYNHPWARCYADFIFRNQAEFEEFLVEYSSHPRRLIYAKFIKDVKRFLSNFKNLFLRFSLKSKFTDTSKAIPQNPCLLLTWKNRIKSDIKKPFAKIRRIKKSKKNMSKLKDDAEFYEMQKKFIGRF